MKILILLLLSLITFSFSASAEDVEVIVEPKEVVINENFLNYDVKEKK